MVHICGIVSDGDVHVIEIFLYPLHYLSLLHFFLFSSTYVYKTGYKMSNTNFKQSRLDTKEPKQKSILTS